MALRPAHPGSPGGLPDGWFRRGAAAREPLAAAGARARAASDRAASESIGHDRVELSAGASGTDAEAGSAGAARASRIYTAPRAAMQVPQPHMLDPSALRVRVARGLIERYGADSPLVAQFQDAADWFSSFDPRLYGSALLVLYMLLEQGDEDAARGMLKAMSVMRSAGLALFDGPVTRQQAAVSAATFEASLTAVFARVQVQDQGRTVQASAGAVRVEASIQAQTAHADPLILDLDGDGIDLRSAEAGPRFDLTGTGAPVQTAFVQGDDAFLFLDRNGNGRADSGAELFGDQHGDAHGFAALARHDANRDGRIDPSDPVYAALRLFQDRNRDGVNQPAETQTLAQAGVAAIDLAYHTLDAEDGKGNRLAQVGRFVRTDGRAGLAADALLRYRRA